MSMPFSRSPVFVTTRWTRVVAAQGKSSEARLALSELCGIYYAPVHSFIIRSGGVTESTAQDLTHEFFERVLGRYGVDGADPAKGRFRSYLLGAVKHFLAEVRGRAGSLKKGGGVEHLPIEMETEQGTSTCLPVDQKPGPDREFDRRWALTILDRALENVRQREVNEKQFQLLLPWLTGDHQPQSQAELAAILGVNEGAVKVAIHRLRKKFREQVKVEVAETMEDPALVAQELECLMEALRG